MTDLRKLLETLEDYVVQALDQHDQQYQRHPSTERDRQVIVNDLEALRQALSQPEQEPVAWVECAVIPWLQSKDTNVYAMTKLHRIPNEHYDTPLYTTPSNREWVGLTDDEIHEMTMKIRTKNMGVVTTKEIFRDVEAKLKEKNNG